MDGVGEVASLLEDYDQVLEAWSDPDADFEKLGSLQAEIEGKIEAAGAWDLQRMVEIAMDALRLPPGDSSVETCRGRNAQSCVMQLLLSSRIYFFLTNQLIILMQNQLLGWNVSSTIMSAQLWQ